MMNEEGDASVVSAQSALLADLEILYHNPININTATREQILRLPFISEAQADSLLLYRQQRRVFRTLGELQVISGIDHTTRCQLSLFTYVGDTIRRKTPLKHIIGRGKHELYNTLHIPLYKRAGYTSPNPYAQYLGNRLSHTLRYRYHHHEGISYGLTLQKDNGEPVAKQGFYPYDYISAYAQVEGLIPNASLLAGDFEVNWGSGLLIGNNYFNSAKSAITLVPKNKSVLRPHTSSAESGFMRGIASSIRWKRDWETMVFLSYDKIDATLKYDTVTSFKTDGLHRNFNEIGKRRTVGQFVAGTRTSFRQSHWQVGANGYYAHYNKMIYPTMKAYNKYYLRGKNVGGISVDGAWRNKYLTYQGELAIDDGAHLATTHLLQGKPFSSLTLTMQGRYFSPRYVSPFAETLQSGSRVQNETGVLFGAKYQVNSRLTTTAYADWCYHPRPMYRADYSSQRFKCEAEGIYLLNEDVNLQLSYRFNTKQQNVTGYDLMEYIGRHQVQFSSAYKQEKFQVNASTSFVVATTQTTSPEYGFLLSTRGKYAPTPTLSLQLFASVFFTDGYSSRIYAYEPQLRYNGGFPTFAYHGMRVVGQLQWEPCKYISLATRYGLLHYFNRESISSGTQQILSPTQNDLWIQVGVKL